MPLRRISVVVLFLFSCGSVAQTGLKPPKSGVKPPAAKGAAQPPIAIGNAATDAELREKTIERIFECLAPGLPQDWLRAWIEIVEKGEVAWNERSLEGRYFYLTSANREKPHELQSCDAKEVAELTVSLNQFLDPDKRRWKAVRLEFNRGDGSFELKYDYGQ